MGRLFGVALSVMALLLVGAASSLAGPPVGGVAVQRDKDVAPIRLRDLSTFPNRGWVFVINSGTDDVVAPGLEDVAETVGPVHDDLSF